MSATAIYDFENNLAAVFAAALTAQSLTAITAKTPPDFQKARPRVEVIFRISAAVTPAIINLQPNGSRFIAAYRGELSLEVLTNTNDSDKSDHATYRAAIRAAMELDVIRAYANQVPSVYAINFVLPSGCSQTLQYQDGYETTKLAYAVDFSIQADAWAQLNE